MEAQIHAMSADLHYIQTAAAIGVGVAVSAVVALLLWPRKDGGK